MKVNKSLILIIVLSILVSSLYIPFSVDVKADEYQIPHYVVTRLGLQRVWCFYDGPKNVYAIIITPSLTVSGYYLFTEIGNDAWYLDFDFNATGSYLFQFYSGTPYSYFDSSAYRVVKDDIEKAVWDAYLENHTISETFGELLQTMNQTIIEDILSVNETLVLMNQTIIEDILSVNETLVLMNQTIIEDILSLNETIIQINQTITNSILSAINNIPDQVWDEMLDEHLDLGSTGKILYDINISLADLNTTEIVYMLDVLNNTLSQLNTTEIVDILIELNSTLGLFNMTELTNMIQDVPDDVWDVLLADHLLEGTTGIAIQATYKYSGGAVMEFEIHTVSEYFTNQTGMIVLMVKYGGIPATGIEVKGDYYYPNNTLWMSDQPFIEIGSTAVYVDEFNIPISATEGVYKCNIKGIYSIGGIDESDTFTEPDGLPDNWNLAKGTWSVVDNKLNHTQHGTYGWVHWSDLDSAEWTDYTFTAMIYPWTTASNNLYGIMSRYLSRTESYIFYFASYNNALRLDKGYSTLISKALDLDDQQWYNFTMKVVGNNIKCYLNDTLEFDYTDIDVLEEGSPALYTASYVNYDNITISVSGIEIYAYSVKDFKVDDTALKGSVKGGGANSFMIIFLVSIAIILAMGIGSKRR